jgi:hypothetical protein
MLYSFNTYLKIIKEQDEEMPPEPGPPGEEGEQQGEEEAPQQQEFKIGLIDNEAAKADSKIECNIYIITSEDVSTLANKYNKDEQKVIENLQSSDTDPKFAQRLAKMISKSKVGRKYRTITVNLDEDLNVYSDSKFLEVKFLFYNQNDS